MSKRKNFLSILTTVDLITRQKDILESSLKILTIYVTEMS